MLTGFKSIVTFPISLGVIFIILCVCVCVIYSLSEMWKCKVCGTLHYYVIYVIHLNSGDSSLERDFKILPSLNIIFDLNKNVIKIVSGNLMNVFIYGNAKIDERFLNRDT